MSPVLGRVVRVAGIGTPFLLLVGLACNQDLQAPSLVASKGPSAAFGLWTPGPGDTCTKDIHDQYAVVGPDGKLYPTWHPPVDPATGCTFGHEHGRDPRGSNLYKEVGAIPFGYANEQLDAWDPANPRHEDHFGHKVEWANDIQLHFGNDPANQLFNITCDVLVKLHQGTHSKDAFTNNLHELAYHIRCSDGTELHVTKLIAIGTPGQFDRSCNGDSSVIVGPATPANSPDGGGRRIIPDRTCAVQLLVPAGQTSNWDLLHESWQTSSDVCTADGHGLAFFNPYFQVFLPSRFYDPSAANITGRPIDVCFWVGPTASAPAAVRATRRPITGPTPRWPSTTRNRCSTARIASWTSTPPSSRMRTVRGSGILTRSAIMAARRRSPGRSARSSRRSTTASTTSTP